MRYRFYLESRLVFILVAGMFVLAEDKQQAANILTSRVAAISDIRSAGSPPFSLKADLKITASDGRTIDGSYVETWISRDQWRIEVVAGNEHRIEMVNQDKDYVLNVPELSLLSLRIQGQMNVAHVSKIPLRVSKLKDGEVMGLKARCVVGEPETLCFDQENGRLLSQAFLWVAEAGRTEWICQYGEYREFGSKVFQRAISCAENGHLKLQIRVAGVSQEDHADLKLFQPPEGATESKFFLCKVKTPPQVLSGPDSVDNPHGFGSGNMTAMVGIRIDESGRVLDPKIVRSGGPQVDHWAINSVLGWHYRPAMCDGVPISTTIDVQFGVHHGH
jgi:TonB family protein